MEQKTHSFSALVTIAILGALTVVAWLYKIGKNEEAQVLQNEVAITDRSQQPTQSPLPSGRQFVPTVRQETANRNYEILLGCKLVESRANDGNTFRIRHRDNEYVFRLYFVDSPETTTNNTDLIQAQTRYFNYIGEEQLLETSRAFTVFTQWKPVHQSHR